MHAEEESPSELIRQVRNGDEAAAVELVRRYEPVIRRQIRVWLRMQDPRLRRVFDSMDVCQSVMASFFVRRGARAIRAREARAGRGFARHHGQT